MLSREGTIERKSPKLLRETVKKSRQSLEESAFRCERTHVRLGQVDEICAPHAHTVQMGTCAQNNFRVFRQRFVQINRHAVKFPEGRNHTTLAVSKELAEPFLVHQSDGFANDGREFFEIDPVAGRQHSQNLPSTSLQRYGLRDFLARK